MLNPVLIRYVILPGARNVLDVVRCGQGAPGRVDGAVTGGGRDGHQVDDDAEVCGAAADGGV